MPTFTIEIDTIDERGIEHPTWIRIGLDGPGLYVDPLHSAELTFAGRLLYTQLSRIPNLGVWFTNVEDTRQAGKFVVCLYDLLSYGSGGFAPMLGRLIRRIAAGCARCGLGDCPICYTLGERAMKAQAGYPDLDSAVWPQSTFAA
ncbi:MAG TPA: hypothetical protein VHQ86_03655 [Candidatus Saccharimonadia bacterium]|nr:hypothetical protein [Candidatus Saccharimonadia bacterium]